MEQTFDLVDKLMAYENNELSDMECVELFSYLDRNNMIGELQGHYGRTCMYLKEMEILNNDGTINEDNISQFLESLKDS